MAKSFMIEAPPRSQADIVLERFDAVDVRSGSVESRNHYALDYACLTMFENKNGKRRRLMDPMGTIGDNGQVAQRTPRRPL